MTTFGFPILPAKTSPYPSNQVNKDIGSIKVPRYPRAVAKVQK